MKPAGWLVVWLAGGWRLRPDRQACKPVLMQYHLPPSPVIEVAVLVALAAIHFIGYFFFFFFCFILHGEFSANNEGKANL